MAEGFEIDGSMAVQELAAVQVSLEGINVSADRVSRTLSRAFASAIVSGKSFDQTLRSVGLSLSRIAMNAGIQPLLQGAMGMASTSLASFFGGAGAPAIAPFADGGIVARPTFFGMGGGLGLMGERGAEAILPLARGPDGRLGIAGTGTGRGERPPVHISINTPDVESFRRSQVQVSSSLARAVMRGQRGL